MPENFLSVLTAAKIARGEGRFADAEIILRHLAAQDPDNAPVARYLAETLASLGQTDEAIALFQAARARWPDDASFLYALADVYERRGDLQDAAKVLEDALAIDGSRALTHLRLAAVLRAARDLPAALAAARRACASDPSSVAALAIAFQLQQETCDWRGHTETAEILTRAAATSDGSLDLFWTHSVPGLGLAEQYAAAVAYAARLGARTRKHGALPTRADLTARRIRLGYVSGDFNGHPVGRHTIGLLENHDRTQFEVFGYSLTKDDGQGFAARFPAAIEHWRDATTAVEDLIYRDGLDILVNLGGYTKGAADALAVCRVAPIQVLYLGYGGTTGSPVMDYLLTDPVISPGEHAPFYSETFAYLPETLFNVARDREPNTDVTRAECGLPENAFVFCCFCNNAKITPAVFDIWMRLLHAVPGSVLWLREFNPFMADNLRKEAAARGIDPKRLIFAGPWDREHHLARHACADLFLDTLPYTAASTAADAAWAGIPIVTCAGDTYVSRQAASVIRAVGLGELVTNDLEDYFQAALRLAENRGALAEVRERLRSNRRSSILFDSAGFTRQVESVYRKMIARLVANEPVSVIDPD